MQTQTLNSPAFTKDLSNLMTILSNWGMDNGFTSMLETVRTLSDEYLSGDAFAAMTKEGRRSTLQEINDLNFVLQELAEFSNKYSGEIELQNVKGTMKTYSVPASIQTFCNPVPVGVVAP